MLLSIYLINLEFLFAILLRISYHTCIHTRVHTHIHVLFVFQEPAFERTLKYLRLQKRGTAGEHTAVVDHTYDISNSERLGKSEVISLEKKRGEGVV